MKEQPTLRAVSPIDEKAIELKERRKAQNKAVEKEIHGIFRSEETDPADKALEGLELLAGKLQTDLEQQFQEMMTASGGATPSYADREVTRLLRMLEKRKDMLDQLHSALALDEELMAACSPFAMRGSDAQN